MIRYIARRCIGMVAVVLLVTMFLFGLMSLVPGDPITARFGMDAGGTLDAQQVAALRHQYGLDRPLPIQYLTWLEAVGHGDLGESIRQSAPVSSILRDRIPVTLQIQVLALGLAIIFAIPAGVIAGAYQDHLIDRALNSFGLLGVAVPSFWIGLLGISIFSVHLGWIPVAQFTSIWDSPVAALKSSILPAATAAFGASALILRQTRAGMIEVMSQDYIRTARAKGMANHVVVIRHGLRNALAPVITVVGLSVSTLLGGSVVIEQLFNIPGMGRLVLQSMAERDYPVVQGITLVVAFMVVVTMLLTDFAYVYFNPRIRLD